MTTVFDQIIEGQSLEEITKEHSIPLNILVIIRIRIEAVFRLQNMTEKDLERVKTGEKIQFPKYFQ